MPFQEQSHAPVPPAGPNTSGEKKNVGRFTVLKVDNPEEVQKATPSPSVPDWDFGDDDDDDDAASSQVLVQNKEQTSQPDRHASAHESPTVATSNVGRFAVQKAETNKEEQMEVKDNINQHSKRGRFAVQKVEEPKQEESNQEKSSQIMTKGRFSIQKIAQEENKESALPHVIDNVNKNRFAVSKVDQSVRDTEKKASDPSKFSQVKPVGRFTVQKANTPDSQRKSHQGNANQNATKTVKPFGRFTVQKANTPPDSHTDEII